MKKTLAVLAVAALAASVPAQTNQVLSRNAVGYVRVTVPPTNLVLACIPFNAFSNTVGAILGTQLTGGASPALSDTVLKWDSVNKTYVTFWKTLAGQWRQFPEGVATTNILRPGEAFFISNKHSTNQDVFVMGEVPDKYTAPTSVVYLVTNLSMGSYSFPVEMAITSLTIKASAKKGASPALSDALLTFDPIAKSYVTFWFPLSGDPRQFPEGVATTNKLAPGQGFFYNRKSTNLVWQEIKPYTWP